jgi:excisionase family DNA binding protein
VEHETVTVPDAAARLEMSPAFVRRLIASGRLPCYRLGRAVRLDPDDVEDYRRSCRQCAAPAAQPRRVAAPTWAEIEAKIKGTRR